MISKLRNNIFWIIQIPLSIIVVGIIILVTLVSYQNTINSSVAFFERYDGRGIERAKERSFEKIEGVYKFEVKGNEIVLKSATEDENLEDEIEIVRKVENGVISKGIVDDYIYSIKKIGPNTKTVLLIEAEDTIDRVKETIVFAIVIGIVTILIIYLVAKKISKTIVKPVEEVFIKQKEFISDASHELKTPLAVIEVNAEVLESKNGESKWLSYIKQEVISMNKLVNDLLTLTRTENTGIENIEKFDLSKEVKMAVSVFESMIFEKNIKLETNIDENIEFEGDKSDIKHIISILVDNAIKHTKENNKINVKLFKEKNDRVILVQNEGEEIKEEDREKIFERFYRVDKTRTRSEKRYGLGLPIAKGIVKKYNGQISANSKDGITTFTVKL